VLLIPNSQRENIPRTFSSSQIAGKHIIVAFSTIITSKKFWLSALKLVFKILPAVGTALYY